MSFQVDEFDGPVVSRLKLLYLLPVALILCPFIAIGIGAWSGLLFILDTAKGFVTVLRTGRP